MGHHCFFALPTVQRNGEVAKRRKIDSKRAASLRQPFRVLSYRMTTVQVPVAVMLALLLSVAVIVTV
jgi:hypothetical protein